jgi:hypothetical protein
MKFIQKRWFHATTKENWRKMKEEGFLWGMSDEYDSRRTYLARQKEDIKGRGLWNFTLAGVKQRCEILLSVKYLPTGVDDDYNPKSWELIVFKPIPIKNIQPIEVFDQIDNG